MNCKNYIVKNNLCLNTFHQQRFRSLQKRAKEISNQKNKTMKFQFPADTKILLIFGVKEKLRLWSANACSGISVCKRTSVKEEE